MKNVQSYKNRGKKPAFAADDDDMEEDDEEDYGDEGGWIDGPD